MEIMLVEEEELKGRFLLGDNASVMVSSVDTKDLVHIFEHMEKKQELAWKLKEAYKNKQSICNDGIKKVLCELEECGSTEDEVQRAIGSCGLHIKMNWSIINGQHQKIFIGRRQFAIIADPFKMKDVIYKMNTKDGSTNGNLGKTLEIEECTEEKLQSFSTKISPTENNEINTLYLNPDAILGILFMKPQNSFTKMLETPEEYVQNQKTHCETILNNLKRGLPIYMLGNNFKYYKTISGSETRVYISRREK